MALCFFGYEKTFQLLKHTQARQSIYVELQNLVHDPKIQDKSRQIIMTTTFHGESADQVCHNNNLAMGL